jgi:serine/threonine protein phosphatase PrpC
MMVLESSALERGDPAVALREAFVRIHHKASAILDLLLAGASCTVCLIDPQAIWVAHVGDCRAMLGVPDPLDNAKEFHFKPVPLTSDHKLSVKGEFDRIVNAGAGEVRKLVGDNVYRLFLPDEDLPGLTLTRALGDCVGHAVGLSHEPALCAVQMEDLAPGSFLLLGSGGIFATMSEHTIANWIGRNFKDAAFAAQTLTTEAQARWEEPGSKARASLKDNIPDCFACLLLYLKDTVPALPAPRGETSKLPASKPLQLPPVPARPFSMGAHNVAEQKRPWREVKATDRVESLRQMQARERF